MADKLVIRGAREHNLRNVSLELPQGPHRRPHRAVRLGEVIPGVRHDLRRGPATLRRVAVGLRPPVPRPDGQARRRLHRRPVARHLHRPEDRLAQPPLDGRHDHRGLRLPAAAVRPDRRPPRPRDRRAARPPDPPADRRPGPPATRGQPHAGPGAGRAGSEGHLRAALRRPRAGRASPGWSSTASSTSWAARSTARSNWAATRSTRSRSSSTGWCCARASIDG